MMKPTLLILLMKFLPPTQNIPASAGARWFLFCLTKGHWNWARRQKQTVKRKVSTVGRVVFGNTKMRCHTTWLQCPAEGIRRKKIFQFEDGYLHRVRWYEKLSISSVCKRFVFFDDTVVVGKVGQKWRTAALDDRKSSWCCIKRELALSKSAL